MLSFLNFLRCTAVNRQTEYETQLHQFRVWYKNIYFQNNSSLNYFFHLVNVISASEVHCTAYPYQGCKNSRRIASSHLWGASDLYSWCSSWWKKPARTSMWIQRLTGLKMHTFSWSYMCQEWHSMYWTQVWEGFQCHSICASEQEWPSDEQHLQGQLSSFWT